ncbi:MAG: divergent polysaccharide deacetylase family protein [Chitinivibrionales bacterium]
MLFLKHTPFSSSRDKAPDFNKEYRQASKDLSLSEMITKNAKTYRITDQDIKNRLFPEKNLREIKLHIPKGIVDELLVWDFQRFIKGRPYKLEKSEAGKDNRICTMYFKSLKQGYEDIRLTIYRTSGYMEGSYKMAFIIKDFRFSSLESFPEIAASTLPLTVAMVPGDNINQSVSRIISETENQILIQLPFEGFRASGKHKDYVIKLHYNKEKVTDILRKCFEIYPLGTGVIDCGGTQVLKDSRIMENVFSYLKKKNSYFIEDETNITHDLAVKTGCPYLHANSITPDTSNYKSSLEKELRKQILVAQKFGSSVVSAEYSQELIPFIREFRSVLKHNGVEIVHISEMPRR